MFSNLTLSSIIGKNPPERERERRDIEGGREKEEERERKRLRGRELEGGLVTSA